MSHKIFDNDLVAIRKSKIALKLNKPACIEMCIHYDYIKNKYDNKSKTLFTDTGSLMYQIKTAGFKPKMYSFLVDNSGHKIAKGVNKNIIAAISHNEYKYVLLNNKCIGHSMMSIYLSIYLSIYIYIYI